MVVVHLAGSSVTRTASLCSALKAMAYRVVSAYHHLGQTTTTSRINRSNCWCKRKLYETDV